MPSIVSTENIKRQPLSVTIREDIITQAKSLNLNTSKAAEAGIVEAIKEEREKRWLEDNKEAIVASNKRIERAGVLLKPDWVT